MKTKFEIIKFKDCNFLFYQKGGFWGTDDKVCNHYWLCIPFIIGFIITKSNF